VGISEKEKRRKWLRWSTFRNCLYLSGAIMVIATIFEIAQSVVNSNLPTIEKTLYILFMWFILGVLILFFGLLSPELMETVFDMLGFKDKEDKKQ